MLGTKQETILLCLIFFYQDFSPVCLSLGVSNCQEYRSPHHTHCLSHHRSMLTRCSLSVGCRHGHRNKLHTLTTSLSITVFVSVWNTVQLLCITHNFWHSPGALLLHGIYTHNVRAPKRRKKWARAKKKKKCFWSYTLFVPFSFTFINSRHWF